MSDANPTTDALDPLSREALGAIDGLSRPSRPPLERGRVGAGVSGPGADLANALGLDATRLISVLDAITRGVHGTGLPSPAGPGRYCPVLARALAIGYTRALAARADCAVRVLRAPLRAGWNEATDQVPGLWLAIRLGLVRPGETAVVQLAVTHAEGSCPHVEPLVASTG